MIKPKVKIIGNDYQVQSLFSSYGFAIVYEANFTQKPDLVCFTGGPDVDPKYYGEEAKKHLRTYAHPARDNKEMLIYEQSLDLPKVGICRGGQLLNVCNGGKLYQNVEGHASNHLMVDLLFSKSELMVTSTHHQMMIPAEGSHILGVARVGENHWSGSNIKPPKWDTEVLWYHKTNSLCYQPHPEFTLAKSPENNQHKDYFFDLIEWAFSLRGPAKV